MKQPARRDELRQWIEQGDAKRWRTAANWSQHEAATEVGVTDRTFARWENQEAFPQGTNTTSYHRFLKSIKPAEPEHTGPTTSKK